MFAGEFTFLAWKEDRRPVGRADRADINKVGVGWPTDEQVTVLIEVFEACAGRLNDLEVAALFQLQHKLVGRARSSKESWAGRLE